MLDLKDVLWVFFPKEIDWNRYELIRYEITDNTWDNNDIFEKRINFYIKEKNIPPNKAIEEWEEILSNWFYEPKRIFDFPVRDKLWSLIIERRRWILKSNGKSVSQDLNIQEKGTMTTKDLVGFLK